MTTIGEMIIELSIRPFGDFHMPLCAKMIEHRGLAQGLGPKITSSDVRRILRRYKEHTAYSKMPQEAIMNDLELFNNALTRVGLTYSLEEILNWFNALPAKRAAPDERV